MMNKKISTCTENGRISRMLTWSEVLKSKWMKNQMGQIRGGDVPGLHSYGTSVIPLLASWHANTHTHTSTNTHTQAFRPDSLLGQMASWWGATRSFTRALGWFVNHNLHTSLLLTPSSTHTAEGWTVKKDCIILHYPYSYTIIDCEIMWNYCIN